MIGIVTGKRGAEISLNLEVGTDQSTDRNLDLRNRVLVHARKGLFIYF